MRGLGCWLAAAIVATAGLVGCSAAKEDEGVPPNIDMTKDYTPPAKTGMVNPGDYKKVTAKTKGAAPEAP